MKHITIMVTGTLLASSCMAASETEMARVQSPDGHAVATVTVKTQRGMWLPGPEPPKVKSQSVRLGVSVNGKQTYDSGYEDVGVYQPCNCAYDLAWSSDSAHVAFRAINTLRIVGRDGVVNSFDVIGIRNLWKKPQGLDATCAVKSLEGVAYDFEGKVYCYNVYGHRHKMAHAGFEKDRDTIKYRCPAQHYGLHCAGRSQCRIGVSVRVPIAEDRRVFGPVARDSYKWKDLYKRRTAAERVYSRMDVSFGFENHTIRGLKKMRLRVGLAYMAMLAMALGRIKANQAEQMRSLTKVA